MSFIDTSNSFWKLPERPFKSFYWPQEEAAYFKTLWWNSLSGRD